MTRYRGKHRPGSPRRLMLGDNMLSVSADLDPVTLDELRRQWDEAIKRPTPIVVLPPGVDWEP